MKHQIKWHIAVHPLPDGINWTSMKIITKIIIIIIGLLTIVSKDQ